MNVEGLEAIRTIEWSRGDGEVDGGVHVEPPEKF